MKKHELRKMSKGEREKQLQELRMELIKSNSQVKSGSAPKNPGKVREIKKSIARLLTISKEVFKKHE
ncbi:50S ribosomal protein L29 [Candidatus Woesearchaeota archaeon]|nr:50S ribosomal protein L29 [Candidatus Woesearchaeota archaeon]